MQNYRKYSKKWRPNNILLNGQWIFIWRNKGGNQKIHKSKQNLKDNLPEPLEHCKYRAKREVYSYKCLY
jgi:hypothetical protein